MLMRLFVTMIVSLLLAGFMSLSDQLKARMEQMPKHYSHFDVKMGWAVASRDNATTIDGIIKNIRYASMNGIEIWVAILDANGKVSARSVDYVIPNRVARDDVAQFAIKLPVAAPAGSKLLFTYKYVGDDGGGSDNDAIAWMQTFESTP